ncbi:MAG: VOC family protein, partial [Myxococcota bacterium]
MKLAKNSSLGGHSDETSTRVPADRNPPAGTLVTIVVEDVDALHATAAERDIPIVEPPRNLFYGQRRMLLRDPAGTLVDVSSECPPSEEFLASFK